MLGGSSVQPADQRMHAGLGPDRAGLTSDTLRSGELLRRGRVPWNRDESHNSPAGHPGSRRCSSFTYGQYAHSSRLAIRAPRSGTYTTHHGSGGLDSSTQDWLARPHGLWPHRGGACGAQVPPHPVAAARRDALADGRGPARAASDRREPPAGARGRAKLAATPRPRSRAASRTSHGTFPPRSSVLSGTVMVADVLFKAAKAVVRRRDSSSSLRRSVRGG
jgi:hypothetical protein